jgi:hypothetical protein
VVTAPGPGARLVRARVEAVPVRTATPSDRIRVAVSRCRALNITS